MGKLKFRWEQHDFLNLSIYGKTHLLTHLGRPGALNFPLFDPNEKNKHSGSPFFDKKKAAEAIGRMNPHLPKPPEDAVYVVTGQQPGLLMGPLYAFLKAAGAISLSEKLSAAWDRPVLPLFWVASEDHDVLEVNRVFVNSTRFVMPYEDELRRGKIPQVGNISLKGARTRVLEFLKQALPETEFTPWVLDLVASADFSNYATAFSSLIRSVFSLWPLRLADAIGIRPLTGPVLAAIVENWPRAREGFLQGRQYLLDSGFKPPLDSLGFFEVKDGVRKAAKLGDDKVTFEEGELSFKEAGERIRTHSENFSPNAGLRPICQDGILPNAVTLGGPAELLYLWQIQPVYSAVKVTGAKLFPRPFAAFIESKIEKALIKAEMNYNEVFDIPSLLNQETNIQDPELDAIKTAVHSLMERFEPFRKKKWLDKGTRAIRDKLRKFIQRLSDEKLEETAQGKTRLKKIANAMYPNNTPQERRENVLGFLNLYGPDFVRLFVEQADPLSIKYNAVFMDARGE